MSLVSIIIPVFDTPTDRLKRSVLSALEQDGEVEVLLVDDGSGPVCAQAVDEIASRFPGQVKALHKQNGGVSSARNVGLAAARGMHIAFLDADDELSAGFVAGTESLMVRTGADVVLTAHVNVGLDGRNQLVGRQHTEGNATVLEGDDIDALKGSLFNASAMKRVGLAPAIYAACWGTLFRASAIEGIRFREDIHISEDRIFNFEVFSKVSRIAIADLVGYKYLQYEKSASQSLRLNAVQELGATANAIENLKGGSSAELKKDIDFGIVECFEQTLWFTILRPGFGDAFGMSKRAMVAGLLDSPLYRDAIESVRSYSPKLRVLWTLFRCRCASMIVWAFQFNECLFVWRNRIARYVRACVDDAS